MKISEGKRIIQQKNQALLENSQSDKQPPEDDLPEPPIQDTYSYIDDEEE